VAAEVAALRRIAAYVERPAIYAVACPCCGVEHQAKRTKGNHRRLCPQCKQRNEMAAKRVARATRKARMRGAGIERIDPLAVFEAEGWMCYLCGVLTDKNKRGTYDPLAPELEHVIPLSKGGTHTRDNVRCACRRCNGLKADAMPVAA
jgi:5-methylcytosine-specific restriction endonuclease McrA